MAAPGYSLTLLLLLVATAAATSRDRFRALRSNTEHPDGRQVTRIAAADALVDWGGRARVHKHTGAVGFNWLGVTARVTVTGAHYLAVNVSSTSKGRGVRLRSYIDDQNSRHLPAATVWATPFPEQALHTIFASNDPSQRTVTLASLVPPEYQGMGTTVVSFETDGKFVNSSTGSSSWPYQRLFAQRKIEFIGDSITAATNVNRPPGDGGCGDSGYNSDWGLSYSALLCRYFGSSCSTIAVGGHCMMEECGFPQMPDYFRAQSFYDPPDVLDTFDFSYGGAGAADQSARPPDAMVIHLGSDDWREIGPNTTGPKADSFTNQTVAFMLNATRLYKRANLTFFLPTGPMVNQTMGATQRAIAAARRLGLNAHWIDMRRTCVGLVHQTHDASASFCEETKGCSLCDGCSGHPGEQGHFNMFAAAAPVIAAQMGWSADTYHTPYATWGASNVSWPPQNAGYRQGCPSSSVANGNVKSDDAVASADGLSFQQMECKMHSLALEFSAKVLAEHGGAGLRPAERARLAAALHLPLLCNSTLDAFAVPVDAAGASAPPAAVESTGLTFFVATNGSDLGEPPARRQRLLRACCAAATRSAPRGLPPLVARGMRKRRAICAAGRST